LENISLGRTDALSTHRLFRTVLSLSRPYNTGFCVKYPVFARILALCRAQIITNSTIHMGSLHTITPICMVGIVIIRARHSAKIRAKSLIVLEKTIVITAHLCSETAFLAKNPITGKLDRLDTQEESMLFNSNQGIKLPPR
jgi:hypothetical protein